MDEIASMGLYADEPVYPVCLTYIPEDYEPCSKEAIESAQLNNYEWSIIDIDGNYEVHTNYGDAHNQANEWIYSAYKNEELIDEEYICDILQYGEIYSRMFLTSRNEE